MTLWKTQRGALFLLLGVSALILLLGLGSRDLWGPETRWANIALHMLQTGNYFDPYLMGQPYYDKPLPSYWLITAPASLAGGLGPWSLRLSSVVAAWLSIWLVYLIGERLYRKGTGLIAGWMLATTFYFMYWGRVATADILTVCGVLAAVWWYWRGPDDTRLGRYCVFFLLLAATSLFKGLIGFVLPGLVLLPHLLDKQRYKRHLNGRLLLAIVIATVLYAVPFVLSQLYGAPNYGASGLALVFRENVVRFFDPFDHMGPLYTYLIYLPAYTLPWTPCGLLGLWLAVRHWRHTPPNVRWLVWGLGLLFMFFTASGSRRSYYVLPLVPFAQLLGAWWLSERVARTGSIAKGWRRGFGMAAGLMVLVLGVIYPWTNGNGGVTRFASDVRALAENQAPWNEWQLVMVDVDNKLPMSMQNHGAPFDYVADTEDYPRQGDSAGFMAWLAKSRGHAFDPQRTIVVVQATKDDPTPLEYLAADHQVVRTVPDNGERFFHKRDGGSVAFIPVDPVLQARP